MRVRKRAKNHKLILFEVQTLIVETNILITALKSFILFIVIGLDIFCVLLIRAFQRKHHHKQQQQQQPVECV